MVGDCDRSGAASRESQASARSQEYYPPRGDGKLGSCLPASAGGHSAEGNTRSHSEHGRVPHR